MSEREVFGKRLKFIRKAESLSLGKLANRLGISRQAVSMWELGRQEPTLHHTRRLAKALGVSVAYLIGETDE